MLGILFFVGRKLIDLCFVTDIDKRKINNRIYQPICPETIYNEIIYIKLQNEISNITFDREAIKQKKLEEREHTRQQKGSRLGGSGASVINKGLPDRLFDEGLPQR